MNYWITELQKAIRVQDWTRDWEAIKPERYCEENKENKENKENITQTKGEQIPISQTKSSRNTIQDKNTVQETIQIDE